MNELDVTERRARFVYESGRLAAMAAGAPIVPTTWEECDHAFQDQLLEVVERQCGDTRFSSSEDCYADWVQSYLAMGWRYGANYNATAKTHPDLVPYEQLEQREKDKDDVFLALCEIARQWIY